MRLLKEERGWRRPLEERRVTQYTDTTAKLHCSKNPWGEQNIRHQMWASTIGLVHGLWAVL